MQGWLRPGRGTVASAYRGRILSGRDRVSVWNRWLERRLDVVLPEIMDREGFDMWIVIAREGNDDPVIPTLLPEPMRSARRRTILVFFRTDEGLERLSLVRYARGPYTAVWNPEEEGQWECLGRVVAERDPDKIGINISETYALADGLTKNEYDNLMAAIGDKYGRRLMGAERLAVGWLERRIPEEIDAYGGIMEIAHGIIGEAFSGRVIHPGVTTTDDVVWWIRQTMADLNVECWFHPTVMIQAVGQGPPAFQGGDTDRRNLIRPGDLLHCDAGLEYLGLATDSQQHAYVLGPGEHDAPEGLKQALAVGNRVQDIIIGEFVEGRTGNEILTACQEKVKAEDIKATFYTHPLGFHGHGAGTAIGMWDNQRGIPGMGDYPLFADTLYSIEFNVRCAIPEWGGREIMIGLEQDVHFDGKRCVWISGRQTELHLI